MGYYSSRDEDLILSLKKAKDSYYKGQAILGLKWLAMMASEVVEVKYYIQQNSEVRFFVENE